MKLRNVALVLFLTAAACRAAAVADPVEEANAALPTGNAAPLLPRSGHSTGWEPLGYKSETRVSAGRYWSLNQDHVYSVANEWYVHREKRTVELEAGAFPHWKDGPWVIDPIARNGLIPDTAPTATNNCPEGAYVFATEQGRVYYNLSSIESYWPPATRDTGWEELPGVLTDEPVAALCPTGDGPRVYARARDGRIMENERPLANRPSGFAVPGDWTGWHPIDDGSFLAHPSAPGVGAHAERPSVDSYGYVHVFAKSAADGHLYENVVARGPGAGNAKFQGWTLVWGATDTPVSAVNDLLDAQLHLLSRGDDGTIYIQSYENGRFEYARQLDTAPTKHTPAGIIRTSPREELLVVAVAPDDEVRMKSFRLWKDGGL